MQNMASPAPTACWTPWHPSACPNNRTANHASPILLLTQLGVQQPKTRMMSHKFHSKYGISTANWRTKFYSIFHHVLSTTRNRSWVTHPANNRARWIITPKTITKENWATNNLQAAATTNCKLLFMACWKEEEIWANAHKTSESLQQFWFISLAENWSVHAKLTIQIPNSLSGSHNDSSVAPPCKWYRLVSQPKIAKKIHKTPYFGIQGHWIWCQSRASVRLPISD